MQDILTSQTEESDRKAVLTQFLYLDMLGKGIWHFLLLRWQKNMIQESEVVSVLYSGVWRCGLLLPLTSMLSRPIGARRIWSISSPAAGRRVAQCAATGETSSSGVAHRNNNFSNKSSFLNHQGRVRKSCSQLWYSNTKLQSHIFR